MTYGRLQGLDNLIEHFENSKIMNQKEKKYRPIIKRENHEINKRSTLENSFDGYNYTNRQNEK